MHSSNNLPALPQDSVPSDAGAWLLVLAIALVPLFWLPVFHTGFEAPRLALVLVVIAPFAALLLPRNWAQRSFARVPAACVLAIVVAGLVPHLLGGFDVHAAWRSIRALGPFLALILAGAALVHPRFLARLRLALVLPAIPVLAIGLLRRYAGLFSFLPDRPDVAISSTLGNSNALGEAFAPVFLAGLVFAPAGETRAQRAWLRIGTACALVLVVISKSRGAQLAAAAGFAVWALLWLRDRRDRPEARRRALAGAGVVLAAAVAFLLLPFGASAREWLGSFVSTTAPTNVVRLSVWSGTAELAAQSAPLGAGLGRFEPAFLPHRRAAEWDLSGPDTRVDSPHQEFLWVASEAGFAGLAALIVLLIVAFRRVTRPPDTLTDLMRPHQKALLLAATSLIVLMCVRSPLHHPSGVLVFATLLGSVAPRVVRPPRFHLDVLVVPLLGAFAIMALLDAREDVRLGQAVAALNAAKGAIATDPASVVPSLQDSGRRLKTVGAAILKDFDRSFRAALAAGELADLKDAVARSAPPEACADFPDQEDVRALLDETLRLCPNHPGATNQLALLWLKQGFVARAETIWQEAARVLPAAPRFHHNLASLYQKNERFSEAIEHLAAETRRRREESPDDRAMLAALGVGLGRDEAGFGRYLGAVDAARPAPAELRGSGRERRRAILLDLHDRPADGDLLAALATTDFALGNEGGTGDSDILAEANRAYARSRVRFAVGALAAPPPSRDFAQAELFLKSAIQKDPGLLDAYFLRAKVAARHNARQMDPLEAPIAAERVLGSLQAILGRGIPPATLRTWVEADEDLWEWFKAGKLDALKL